MRQGGAGRFGGMLAAPLALAALLAAAAPDAGTGQGRVLDRIVAIVDRQPLTLSQLELEARVAFIANGGTDAATAPLGDRDLASALELAIDQRLVLAEADRLRVYDVDDAAVASALKDFQARLHGDKQFRAFLDSQETTAEEVAAILRRALRVSRFLDSKIKLASHASEDDLRRYFAAHASELGDLPYDRQRDTIRALITRERKEALTRKQLDELRARADVRTVIPFATGPAGDAGTPP